MLFTSLKTCIDQKIKSVPSLFTLSDSLTQVPLAIANGRSRVIIPQIAIPNYCSKIHSVM